MCSMSVYEEARKAADEHKWLQSERAGYDLGSEAVRDWTRSHWLKFYRCRFVQHLRGELFWKEFDEQSYGLAGRHLVTSRQLLDEILDCVKRGAENLDLIINADDCGWPMDQVMCILEALDINSKRLAPPE